MFILALDPGNSTGYVTYRTEVGSNSLSGGTIFEDFESVFNLCKQADLIVYETFNMYPGAAKHLVWNSFYPCQVIGVIELAAQMFMIPVVRQSPGIKKFSGGLDKVWKGFVRRNLDKTEHTKDAFLHLKYYLIKEKMFWNKQEERD